MIYTLTTPINVGDLNHAIIVDKLEIVSISFNFDPTYVAVGTAVLSIVLLHRASGYKHTVTYQDASALAYWNAINVNNVMNSPIFQKLMADGKLPAGSFA